MVVDSTVIDLTDSPPENHAAPAAPVRRQAGSKRLAVVELEGDEQVEQRPGLAEDEAARQRIMNFARTKRAKNSAGSTGGSAPMQQLQPVDAQANPSSEDESQDRQRIMDHSRRVNEQRGIVHDAPLAGDTAAGGTHTPPAGTNSLLAQLHAERLARQQQKAGSATGNGAGREPLPQQPGSRAECVERGQGSHQQQQQQQQQGLVASASIKLLTHNVWFQEACHVEARMAAIAEIVATHRPDFLCLQEVTPLIHALLSSAPWWREYATSPLPHDAPYFTMLMWRRAAVQRAQYSEIPFANSMMGRDLKTVAGTVGGLQIRVATSHLESPTGWDQSWSEQRVQQCKQAVAVLDATPQPDVLFAGDMNWGPSDGQPPLPASWCDAWLQLHPDDPGLTYDPKANPMLKTTNRIRRRLDRVFAKLQQLRVESVEMVGTRPLPGLSYEGRPVLPSDHFGLLLTLKGKDE